jgi:hypothetical protein
MDCNKIKECYCLGIGKIVPLPISWKYVGVGDSYRE